MKKYKWRLNYIESDCMKRRIFRQLGYMVLYVTAYSPQEMLENVYKWNTLSKLIWHHIWKDKPRTLGLRVKEIGM